MIKQRDSRGKLIETFVLVSHDGCFFLGHMVLGGALALGEGFSVVAPSTTGESEVNTRTTPRTLLIPALVSLPQPSESTVAFLLEAIPQDSIWTHLVEKFSPLGLGIMPGTVSDGPSVTLSCMSPLRRRISCY